MDKELERAIDNAGRDAVFAAARANGWGPGTIPPRYVLLDIVAKINRDKTEGRDVQ